MDWALLAIVGVPLVFCATAILVLVFRNRELRRRPGDVPVRLRRSRGERWRHGHGIWVSDVFTFRQSPAAWKEAVLWVRDARIRLATDAEREGLHRLGETPVIATFDLASGDSIELAAGRSHRDALLGPFAASGDLRTLSA